MIAFTLPEFGGVIVPLEFERFISADELPVVKDDETKPSEVLNLIRLGKAVVMIGDFAYIVGVLKYLDRSKYEIVDSTKFEYISNKFERSRLIEGACRDALYKLLVVFKDDRLVGVANQPELAGFIDWLEGGSRRLVGSSIIVPVRKVLRVASDIKRYRDGIYIDALEDRIWVFPHIYPPCDRKVVAMLADNLEVKPTDRVLDMGTGTGTLAFIAARKGAEKVTATDVSSQAVKNARFNVEKLGLSGRVEVRGPAHLFDDVKEERFDIVLFNAPWVYGEPQNIYEAAIYDKDGALITEFFRGVGDHLTEGGAIYLQYGNTSELTGHHAIENLERLIHRSGFRITDEWSEARLGRILGKWEKMYLYRIVRK
jgi:SAM-dependent methyltransferase